MKNTSIQINKEGKEVNVAWEIVEKYDYIHSYARNAAARGIGSDGSEWECGCVVFDTGGDDWKIIEYFDVWQDFTNDDTVEKLWVTEIIAIDPRQPEIGGKPNYKSYGGPNVPGKTKEEAEKYCQDNGLGYCKVTGILIQEIPITDEEFDRIVNKISNSN